MYYLPLFGHCHTHASKEQARGPLWGRLGSSLGGSKLVGKLAMCPRLWVLGPGSYVKISFAYCNDLRDAKVHT